MTVLDGTAGTTPPHWGSRAFPPIERVAGTESTALETAPCAVYARRARWLRRSPWRGRCLQAQQTEGWKDRCWWISAYCGAGSV
jgi:hypothetical protein